MRYLLDTNVCVDFLTGRYPSVAARLRESSPDDVCTSSIVAAELRYGADRSRRSAENHAALDRLFSDLRTVDFDLAAASAYGRVRSALELRGEPIGPNDMLIAAHALSLGLVLATDNEREMAFSILLACSPSPAVDNRSEETARLASRADEHDSRLGALPDQAAAGAGPASTGSTAPRCGGMRTSWSTSTPTAIRVSTISRPVSSAGSRMGRGAARDSWSTHRPVRCDSRRRTAAARPGLRRTAPPASGPRAPAAR